ncbi:zinc finger BED domain-containing protein RICESLEEPER 1-like [Pistacia vera]|uniref:zinc finger BED domain-containing protein RICESLEEPER 1-like n=1 Tax=Pistacia vera TaxID=55513 RepID=UPI00126370A9|nr:zinc finger BED domain-containing protein RICESLEEPER 1-like [Pistacia vera]
MVYFWLDGREDNDEIELEEDQIYEVERLKFCLEDWNIDKKVCSMGGDSVFTPECGKIIEDINSWLNERASFPVIRNFFSISFLQYGLGMEVRESYISDKACKIYDYCRTSSNVNKFQDAAEKALFKGKTVTSSNVPSYWWFDHDFESLWACNDGFIMLEWILGCKEAFSELKDIDPDFKYINFIENEWDEVTLICNVWKVLNGLNSYLEFTNKTANVYFPVFSDIMLKLVELGERYDNYIFGFASEWRERLEEYWNNSNLVLVIAVILDPRFKMDIVKHFYEKVYGNDANEYLKIIDDVTNIYNKYAGSTDNNIVTSESELDRYLKDSKCPPGEAFNILDWWRVESRTYPTLAKIARDVLPIQVASPERPSSLRRVYDAINYANLEADLQLALVHTNVWLKLTSN